MPGIGILLNEMILERFGVRESLERLREIGFDSFEIPEKFEFTEGDIQVLKDSRLRFGFNYTFHTSTPKGGINMVDPFDKSTKEKIEKSLDLAAELGAEIANFDFDYLPIKRINTTDIEKAREILFSTFISNLRFAGDYAEKKNIAVAAEIGNVMDVKVTSNLKIGSTPEDFNRMIEVFPRLKITLDYGHLYLSSKYYNFDMFNFIERFSSNIIHTHIHDNFGQEYGDDRKDYAAGVGDLHLPLGRGCLPWQEITDKILGAGYNGIFMLEIKPVRFLNSLKLSDTEVERLGWEYIADSYKKLANLVH